MATALLARDKQHIQRIMQQQGMINTAFNQFIRKVSPMLRRWTNPGGSSVWVRNAAVEKQIDIALLSLQSSLLSNIEDFQFDAWKRSSLKNDEIVRKFIEGMAISAVRKKGYYERNREAFEAYQRRTDDKGLNLSSKVWNITSQMKENVGYYLSTGLSEGRSSDEIGRDVRQLLNEPDKRFRRIRNKEGKLVLSKPMADYHPGAGVYRSAKMNALRLTATETNMAYREADYNRWQHIDFILGVEVNRSPSHRGPCPICDAMVGLYPKDFKFIGWHPFCICIATPKMMDAEDFVNYLIDDEINSSQIVDKLPNKAVKFIADNEYMRNSYGYRDNKEWFEDKNEKKR